MLIAVSCLSPVRIQILMSAFISVSMVSGTLSWSLSSIAVAPSSCRFYARDEERTNRKGKKVTTEEGLENILWASIVSLTHFPLISCSCLSHRKTTKSFLGYWICYYACVCVCLCVPNCRHHLVHMQGHTILAVFYPGNLVVLWGWLQAHIGPKQGKRFFDKTQE